MLKCFTVIHSFEPDYVEMTCPDQSGAEFYKWYWNDKEITGDSKEHSVLLNTKQLVSSLSSLSYNLMLNGTRKFTYTRVNNTLRMFAYSI